MYYGEYSMYLGSRHHLKSRYLQRGKWGDTCVSVCRLLVYFPKYHVSTRTAPGQHMWARYVQESSVSRERM